MPGPDRDNRSKGPDAAQFPYSIELWKEGKLKKVVARAAQASLAQAIYRAAQAEHPEERVILRCEDKVLASSSGQ